jgi:hypothetical protein
MGILKSSVVDFLKFSVVFLKKRPEWVYTLFCFAILLGVYVRINKTNQQSDDIKFVKKYIEGSTPLNQVGYINKMIRREEFYIDRNLVTSIRITPSSYPRLLFGMEMLDINSNFAFNDNDSALYAKRGEWRKYELQSQEKSSNDDDQLLLFDHPLEYDKSSVYLKLNMTSLVFWRNFGRPIIYKFNKESLENLLLNDGSLYFFRAGLATIDLTKPKMMVLPFQGKTSKLINSDPVELREVNLPEGIKDVKPFMGGMIAIALNQNKYSLYHFRDINDISEKKQMFQQADTILNFLNKWKDFEWSPVGDRFIFFNNETSEIVILSDNTNTRIIRVRPSGFSDLPKGQISKEFVWFWGKTDANKLRIVRVNLFEKSDILDYHELPDYFWDDNDRYPVAVNLNDNGAMVVVRNGKNFSQYKLFSLSNKSKGLESLTFYQLMDSSIVDKLSSFRIEVPSMSPSFEFFISSYDLCRSRYEIIPGGNLSSPEVIPIKDYYDKSSSGIIWSRETIFDAKSSIDYFYLVILIIGAIILYFFCLFYILDYKHREHPVDNSKIKLLEGFSTLYEKLISTKNAMTGLKLRSEIMLWLGITIGVAGMFAFVYSLKTFFQETRTSNTEFIVRMLRTFAIFSFMEVFSFYFLKQYRIVFNEYKRFYSLYLRLMNYYQYIESLTQQKDDEVLKAGYQHLREAMLKDTVSLHDESTLDKINEFDRTVSSDIVKALADKIPKAN